MCGIQFKITWFTKKQGNLNLHEKRQSTDTNAGMTQMLELSDNDSKSALIKMFQQAITNTLKINENIESLSKEIEDMKKNQMEILELKNTII